VHRKKFAEVKSGILAMEGTSLERERYLERNWPPAFWAYLEGTQLLHYDATAGLSELKNSSLYFEEAEIMSIADMFHSTAAHRAPAIFLQMVGESPEGEEDELPNYEDGLYDNTNELPSIGAGRPGLFEIYDPEDWAQVLLELLPEDLPEELHEKLYRSAPQDIAASPPEGTPELVIVIARKWRLHQLRTFCRRYVNSSYEERHVSRSAEMFWPGSAGNTVTVESDFVWTISRNAPSLMLYSEFSEHSRMDEDENRQLWRFKTLLTRTAPDEEEDVVGYMAGWLVVLASDNYVCNDDRLREDVGYIDRMLSDGIKSFLKGYLSYGGFEDLVEFVNSGWNSSVAITEIVLRDKYKKQGLVPLAFTGFNVQHSSAPYTDFSEGWLEWADFGLETGADILEREPDVHITPPGVFMVPAARKNKRLRRYLMGLAPQEPDSFTENEVLEVFPFHPESLSNERGRGEDEEVDHS
jgi:hypothetical protein